MSEGSVAVEAEPPRVPRIYVASLADRNAGRLHGRWIDADQPAGTIREQIAEMLADSREPIAEEWAIHDHENFGDLWLSEIQDIEKIARVARSIVQYGPVFAELVGELGGVAAVGKATLYMELCYWGAYGSLADFAREFIEHGYSDALRGLPKVMKCHIDYDGIGREMELNGGIFTLECGGSVHVFNSCI